MRVLVFSRWPVGGIRTYFRYVYGQPAFSDAEITVLAPPSKELSLLMQDAFPAGNVSHEACENGLSALSQALWNHSQRSQYDLIHSHGLTSAMIAGPIARIRGAHHIATLHDVFFAARFKGVAGWFKRQTILQLLGLADCINPVGLDVANNLELFFKGIDRRARVYPIRNGILTDRFQGNQRRSLRDELKLAPQTLLLGFFGRFMGQKGFNLLVDAVDRSRKSATGPRLHVACFGWGGFIREEQAELEARGLSSFFSFLPHVEEMGPALRGVDIVTIPSRWEACPLLPMEAMVAGVPTIASDCIGMREVTKDTPVTVFPSGDAGALQEAIARVAAELEPATRQAEAFREQAARRFDAARTAEQLASLYEAVVSGSDLPKPMTVRDESCSG